MALPKYKSDIAIEAARILDLRKNEMTDGYTLTLASKSERSGEFKQRVEAEYLSDHVPANGGYFIRLPDGNSSYMDKELFEQLYRPYVAVKPEIRS